MTGQRWFFAGAAACTVVVGIIAGRSPAGSNPADHQTAISRHFDDEPTYPVVLQAQDFDKQFADRMAALDSKDVAGRLELARWAFDRRQYSKAHEAVDSALNIDPTSSEAAELSRTISSQERLESAGSKPPPSTTPVNAPPLPKPVEVRTLTNDDINVIRQTELTSADTDSRLIQIPVEVRRKYVEDQNLNYAQFNSMRPIDQAIAILDKGDSELKKQVRIMGQPQALAEFKRVVQPVVLGGCASMGCHGGSNGGGLVLLNPASNDTATYTNFYILTQYSKSLAGASSGQFQPRLRKMIDRGHADDSLLLQYGLPASISDTDHPKVENAVYNGVFRNKQDSRYQQIANWMDRTLRPTESDYGISFRGASDARPATQPATAPASGR